jgi:2-dehydro-3-deoxygluconokinase
MTIIAFGECMIELRGGFGDGASIGYAGDSFNTALYLSRLGHTVSYATALGDDNWSLAMQAAWGDDGIGLNHVLQVAGKMPGLYAISTDAYGERSFSYWRSDSAVRRFFEHPDANSALKAIATASMFYLTGITLSLFDADNQRRLLDAAKSTRDNGGQVVFDPNYRPAGWTNAKAAAKAFKDFAPVVSILLTSLDDEEAVFGHTSADAIFRHWHDVDIDEIVVTGGRGALHLSRGGVRSQMDVQPIKALDTTGAGDSFNAGYLHARLSGRTPNESARFGAQLARLVVQHHGAIIPKDAFQLFLANTRAFL